MFCGWSLAGWWKGQCLWQIPNGFEHLNYPKQVDIKNNLLTVRIGLAGC